MDGDLEPLIEFLNDDDDNESDDEFGLFPGFLNETESELGISGAPNECDGFSY